ncbi:hypothetical protein HYQ46_009816 [Verticillium longisporum]|nr:hypothetical protein HYQ46_009816 [Verticillium longisporum]
MSRHLTFLHDPEKRLLEAFCIAGRVVNNNGLGRVQCNVEINYDNYTYEAVPAFTVRFPVSFDRPKHVTGFKCYKA